MKTTANATECDTGLDGCMVAAGLAPARSGAMGHTDVGALLAQFGRRCRPNPSHCWFVLAGPPGLDSISAHLALKPSCWRSKLGGKGKEPVSLVKGWEPPKTTGIKIKWSLPTTQHAHV